MAGLTTPGVALTLVEVALKNTILLALGQRIAPAGQTAFADVPALRTQQQAVLRGDELAFVAAKGFTYQFSRTSTAADDGDLVIAPSDAVASGRWLKTSSATRTGYAKQVRVHTGDDDFKLELERANAARPSIHLVFDGVTPYERSLSRGALYSMKGRWRVKCVGSNLRSQAQAAQGSDVPSDTDPGSHQMIGDVIAAVAGSQLGQTGVVYADIEEEAYAEAKEGGRTIAEGLAVNVFYTVHQLDSDLVTIDALSGITVQRQLLGGGSAYDASNVILSGYTVPTGAGFTKTPTAGTARVNGTAVSSSPGSVTFPANSDTYRDLHSDGTFSYTSVANGRPAPALVYTGASANTIRAGVTVTDASGVIYDAMLASALTNFEAVDVVPAAGWSITSIAVSPTSATIASGQTQKFTATATYSDGRTADISTAVTWTSSATSKATIDYSGLASWVASGSSTISCSYDGLTAGNTAALTLS